MLLSLFIWNVCFLIHVTTDEITIVVDMIWFLVLIKNIFIFSCRTRFVHTRFILQRGFCSWIQGWFDRWCRSPQEKKSLPHLMCYIFVCIQVERENMVVRFKITPYFQYIPFIYFVYIVEFDKQACTINVCHLIMWHCNVKEINWIKCWNISQLK